jgi:hypothetical protein
MPTPTYFPLANITLGSSASSVSFSSIPASYRDVIVVLSSINTVDDTGYSLRLNGDTGSNYNIVQARGAFDNNTRSNSETSVAQMFLAGWSIGQGTSSPTPLVIQFMDYSATDKHKTVLIRSQTRRNDGSTEVGMLAGRWASTSAIDTIRFQPSSGSFAANTTVSLYGIAS